MASLNNIKSRMRSVTGTRQITHAMELVSSSKLRAARERAESSRPYGRAVTQAIAGLGAAAAACDGESAFLRPRAGKRTCYVVIAGDRGLAGAYNSNLFRRVATLAGQDDYCVLPIGKKATEHFRKRRVSLLDVDCGVLSEVDIGSCSAIASLLCREYAAGRIDRVVVVYTHFVSMLTQEATEDVLLPIDCEAQGATAGDYMTDEEPVALVDSLVPFCVSGFLWAAVCEAVASEHGARRNAMSAATKNAGELIDRLRLTYNRARQAAITQEITEIVSGADAL